MTRRIAAVIAAMVVAAAVAAGCGEDAAEPAPAPDAFVRAPYLTRVGETTARLRWIARDGAAVRIEAVAGDGPPVRARGGDLTGLRPDTRYDWTATVNGAEAASGTVTTAPTSLDRPLDLIFFADYGAPNDDFRAVAALAAAERPRLLVTGGDNAYVAALPQLLDDQIFRPLRDVLGSAPNYGVVGDHDIVFESGQRALVNAFEWPGDGERYDLRYGPVQVVGLGLRGDPGDVAFAERALARPGPLARFVVVHQPLKAGDPLLPVIAAAEVTAVLSGHLHAYERRARPEVPGVPFLTVGTGGGPVNDERTPRSEDALVYVREFGLLRVRLTSERADYEFVDVNGRVRDRASAPLTP